MPKLRATPTSKINADYLSEKAQAERCFLDYSMEPKRRLNAISQAVFGSASVTQISHYREIINGLSLSMFIDDYREVDPSYTAVVGRIYQEYRAYCARNGEYTEKHHWIFTQD